jgi:hypothetical protein
MSIPSQPSDPQRRSACQGTSTPRPPTPDTGPNPPLIPQDQLRDYPNPDEPEDVAAEMEDSAPPRLPRLDQPPRGKRLARQTEGPALHLTAEQRLLLLDTWRRSGLPASDFAALVGLDEACR